MTAVSISEMKSRFFNRNNCAMINVEYDFRGMTPKVATKARRNVNKYIADETIARTVKGIHTTQ